MQRLKSICLLAVLAWPALAEPPGFYFLQFQLPNHTRAPSDGQWLVSNEFTVEMWWRLDDHPADFAHSWCFQGTTGFDYRSPENGRWWIPNDPGGWSFFLKTGKEDTVGTPPIEGLPLDTWIHIAATYDGATMRLFIDGTEVASAPHSGALEPEFNPNPLGLPCLWYPEVPQISLGSKGDGDPDGLVGSIRDVAIWDRALPAMNIAARTSHNITGTEPGLIHYWPLDDGVEPSRNLVSDRPPMVLGFDPLAEGPFFGEPEWMVTDPFYRVREDWIDDVPPGPDELLSLDSSGVADFNRDGWDDFIYNGLEGDAIGCDPEPRPFTVLLSDGSGRFVDGTSQVIDGPIPDPEYAFRSLVADFNGDDLPDFFAGNTGDDACTDSGWTNTLLLTNQNGKLYDASDNLLGHPCTSLAPHYEGQAPCHLGGDLGGRPPGVHYPDIAAPLTTLHRDFTHSTAAGDIDEDGHIDIFVGNVPDLRLEPPYFLLNDGTGQFEANWDFVPIIEYELNGRRVPFTSSQLADLDGDGFEDLLLCCATENPNAPPNTPEGTLKGGIFWGNGSGDFSAAAHTPFPTPGQEWPYSSGGLQPIDIEDDGDLDLVVGYDASNGAGSPATSPDAAPNFLQVLINQGNRQFVDESAARILTPSSTRGWIKFIHEVDFNTDGCPDFLVEHAGRYWRENIYLNDCSGRFAAIHPAVVGKLRQLIPIDAHGDGDLDFVSFTLDCCGPDPDGDFAILEKVRPYITTLFRDGFESGDTSTWSSSTP